MNFNDYLQSAIEFVSAWKLPEEEFAQAANDQARLMCGMKLEPSSDLPLTSPYATLRF
jgi:hypothetical protein